MAIELLVTQEFK